MSTKDLSIESFKNINEIYKFIDTNSFATDNFDPLNLWVKYRNYTTSDDEKQKAQWEVEVNMFYITGNEIFSFSYSYSQGKNVEIISKYPDLDKFQQDGFDYLLKRAKESKSSIVKARYYHLLWKSITNKNQQHAVEAIQHYILSIECLYKLLASMNDSKEYYRICRLYEKLVSLCNDVSHNIDKVKKLTQFLLYKASDIEFHIKHSIIQNMLKYPRVFKKKDFENILSIYENELLVTHKPHDDYILATMQLPTALKVAQKTNSDQKKWHNEIGYAQLRSAEKEHDESRFWLKQNVYVQALQAFRLAGNIKMTKEVERLYSELKPKIKLETYRVDVDEKTQRILKEAQENIKKEAKRVLCFHPFEVYTYISQGHFFPKHADVVAASQKSKEHFLDFVTTIHFDNNKNITGQYKDSNLERIYDTYEYKLNAGVLPLLHYTLVLGIQSGHLTSHNFIEYLFERTWIGKPFVKYDLGGDKIEFNYISILAPSIIEYFNQVHAWGMSQYYTPNFVLCIDSLTLKIEGLLRNFCERLNIPTSTAKRKGMQEALINTLLDNETIKKYFNDEDLFLFNYLFSVEGINLRNNIAHCFYHDNNYSPDFMLLLIAVVLRIGKYNMTITKT